MGLLQVVVFSILLVLICVVMHYEFLHYWPKLEGLISKRPRGRILRLVLCLILLHSIEMIIFGFGYWYLGDASSFAYLIGENTFGLADCIYYAAAVYTTVGFGDIVPLGPIRFLTGLEGLVGFLLITWSASFTFLEMQRYWER